MRSIHGRLLLAASLVLAAFLGLGALAIDGAYRESAERALQTQMMSQVYALLSAADTDPVGKMRLPENLPDPRFSNPDSGLYAQVTGEEGGYLWQSPSTVGRSLPLQGELPPGEPRFSHLSENESLYLLRYALLWEDDSGREIAYQFVLAESDAALKAQLGVFRKTIMLWLGGAALLLLLMQGVVLRWGLKPLRTVATDLQMIERGEQEQLQGTYPKELRKLTLAINSMIRHSTASRDRYRNSLGDLAHSLKTPLAVLQGAAEDGEAGRLQKVVMEQVPRMNEIVQYQLKSAAVAGRAGLPRATRLRPLADRLVDTLQMVYRERGVRCDCKVSAQQGFPLEQGDLLEVLGNILENGFKYARSRIVVSMTERGDRTAGEGAIGLCVEDDGPGIPEAVGRRVVRRGERADQRYPGQGIGLAVANEVLHLNGGELELGRSESGGARIVLWMPRNGT
ncbi:MAG: ATP-binding protein [Sedimenticola sp.]|nr:ATP-binding protein [Sedimenticola sp.]